LLKLKKSLMISSSSSGQLFGIVMDRKAMIAGLCLLSAALVSGIWGTFSAYQTQQLSITLQQTQRALDHAQLRKDAKLAAFKQKMLADEQKLALYARTLGQMQARMSRLDMLGTRLVDVASLDKAEFDFGLEPAVGGPRQQPILQQSGLDLEDRIKHLDERLKQLSTQLTSVDFILENKRDVLAARPHAWPTEGGWISSRFGPRFDPFNGSPTQHYGIDIANRYGAPILSASRGVVTFAGKMKDFGYVADIEHGHGYKTRYAHMGSLLVNVGDVVDYNALLGRIGSSGRSTGPHLHYEVRRFGKLINPASFLPRG